MIVLCWSEARKLQMNFNILNNAHNSISYTMKKENNIKHTFLGVQVKREENNFLTKLLQLVI